MGSSQIETPPPPASSEPSDAGEDAPLAALDDGGAPLHKTTLEELLALFTVKPMTEKQIKMRGDPDMFLRKNFGVDGPAHINQGNPALAHHAISREQCLAGLKDIVLQTPEQRAICGEDNMVPIYRHGDPHRAKTCIDVFEFPNKACELPFVWIAPVQAQAVCELQGKRLCAQEEWTDACRRDPEGKDDSVYAYGDEMDLSVCNTNKPPRELDGPKCEPDSARTAWSTCGTNTEPTGSFPKCRSRLGVFDQHGNVAEIMTRYDPEEEKTVSQLKGSAFFYVDVARKHNERPPKDATHETYPDHCAYDPRWHVEPMDNAWHVNYHLGFRCCKTVK
jgi:hypothetical protein